MRRLPAFAIACLQQCQMSVVRWSGEHWQVCCDNSGVHECLHDQKIDRIWLATGSQLNVTKHPLLKDVLDAYPIEVAKGLPVVDEYLRWRGCEVFIMGGLHDSQAIAERVRLLLFMKADNAAKTKSIPVIPIQYELAENCRLG